MERLQMIGEELMWVVIQVQGTTKEVLTDVDGKFY